MNPKQFNDNQRAGILISETDTDITIGHGHQQWTFSFDNIEWIDYNFIPFDPRGFVLIQLAD